jgi:hypothetical protein
MAKNQLLFADKVLIYADNILEDISKENEYNGQWPDDLAPAAKKKLNDCKRIGSGGGGGGGGGSGGGLGGGSGGGAQRKRTRRAIYSDETQFASAHTRRKPQKKKSNCILVTLKLKDKRKLAKVVQSNKMEGLQELKNILEEQIVAFYEATEVHIYIE